MIGYVTLGTNDLPRAAAFYDALLATLGAKRIWESDSGIGWAGRNGVMVALSMKGKDAVDAFYAKAIELGAIDEGAPGLRGENFYGAYFRDPDGNKLCGYFMVET
jgi:predicted lactoylglutathione lyase